MMLNAIRRGAALFALLCLVLVSAACAPSKNGATTPEVTTPPVTTPGATEPESAEKTVAYVSGLLALHAATRAESEILYTSRVASGAVDYTLSADSVLLVDLTSGADPIVSYEYRYEVLNPIGSPTFKSTLSDRKVGTLEYIAEHTDGMTQWIKDTSGITLGAMSLTETALESYRVTEDGSGYTLTAEVKDGGIDTLFPGAFERASDMTLTVVYTAERVSSISLSYRAGERASVSVTTVFGYDQETVTVD